MKEERNFLSRVNKPCSMGRALLYQRAPMKCWALPYGTVGRWKLTLLSPYVMALGKLGWQWVSHVGEAWVMLSESWGQGWSISVAPVGSVGLQRG